MRRRNRCKNRSCDKRGTRRLKLVPKQYVDSSCEFKLFERAGWENVPIRYHASFGNLTTQAIEPLLDAADVHSARQHFRRAPDGHDEPWAERSRSHPNSHEPHSACRSARRNGDCDRRRNAVASALLGLSVAVSHLTWLRSGLRIVGGIYPLYLGVQVWRAADHPLRDFPRASAGYPERLAAVSTWSADQSAGGLNFSQSAPSPPRTPIRIALDEKGASMK